MFMGFLCSEFFFLLVMIPDEKDIFFGVSSRRSREGPGEGNGNSLQYSCLENPMDGGASWAKVHGVTKSRTQLSDFTFILRTVFTFFKFTHLLVPNLPTKTLI